MTALPPIGAPVLETERLRLRAPEPRDFEAFAGFLGSARARFMGGPVPRWRARRAFRHVLGHWPLRGYGPFVIEREGVAIGQGGPWRPADSREVEMGYCLWDGAHEGHGYALEAMRAARAEAWSLGLVQLVSYIEPPNAPSIRLAERLGCARDDGARRPDPGDLVYRHPAPEAAA